MPHWNSEISEACRRLAEVAWDEDVRNGVDCTSKALIDSAVEGCATFVSRNDGIVCGVTAAAVIMESLTPELELIPFVEDGETISSQTRIAEVRGSAAGILSTERICLNLLGRLSGISTLTAQYVRAVQGTKASVFDTRKTTPGLRLLEKYAVACGGGENHRMGLFDAILIKDNHLALSSKINNDSPTTIEEAIRLARQWIANNSQQLPHGRNTIVQIEVDTLEQLSNALAEPPDIVLLDNMDLDTLGQAVALRDETAPRVLLEASGGVTLKTIGAIAATGVNRISVGALTHSATNFDIGLDWNE